MTWMNEHEVEDAYVRWSTHQLLGPAIETLQSLIAGVNRCSDGWPYWRKPAQAAQRLQYLIMRDGTAAVLSDRERTDVTAGELRAAYKVLRAFRTTHPNCQFRIVAAPDVPGDPEPEYQPDLVTVPVRVKTSGGRVKIMIDWPDGQPVDGEFTGQLRQVVRTATGRELGQAELDQLAAEAEAGYEVNS